MFHMSCSSVCHQFDSWSVFAYSKQRATVLVGSVLKWRARPHCLHRQLKCLCISKTESYSLSRICFEMTRQATMPSSKAWLCLADEQHSRLFISRSLFMHCCCCCDDWDFGSLFCKYWVSWAQKADFEPISNFVQILLVVCQNCRNQLDANKQCLIRAHCSIVTVNWHKFVRSTTFV
jgi:hypothetical protein